MLRYRSIIYALPLVVASVACAQDGSAQAPEDSLCRAVAHHLWSRVAAAPLDDQTPLAALTAAAPANVQIGEKGLEKPGQSIADRLVQDHAAGPELAGKLRDLPPREAVRFGDTDVWLLDRVDGTLGCHTPVTVIVPNTGMGAVHEIHLPDRSDPTELCALSALTAVTIDGNPALWIEQSGGFSNSLAQSTIAIAALHDTAFAPPCIVEVDYAVTDRAIHAFCDGVDCVPLIRTAETLAMRLRQEETAESLGAGAIRPADNSADYRRMSGIVSSNKQSVELPTFGVAVDTAYLTFADQVIFPVRLDDGYVYLARLGHGGFGWRQTADTLLALYRLQDHRIMPAASVYISARRTGLLGVAIQ